MIAATKVPAVSEGTRLYIIDLKIVRRNYMLDVNRRMKGLPDYKQTIIYLNLTLMQLLNKPYAASYL
jgi:hypothetical protein